MHELANRIVDLRLSLRRACMCENTDNNKKSTLSLKTKVLFLISRGANAKEITLTLCIAKTNLALITSSLIEDGFIVKSKNPKDKREIIFTATAKGKRYLSNCLDVIEQSFKNILTEKKEYADAVQKLDGVLEILSFLSY